MITQETLIDQPIQDTDFFDKISEDIKKDLIILLSERGHGKSSSLRTIVDYCNKQHKDIYFKIFDVSQAWYHCAPVKYRQHITLEKIKTGQIANTCDCVYEIGALPQELRRAFVGEIVSQDWVKRYELKRQNPKALKNKPWIIYIFEEANVYFGSYSFRKNDQYSAILQDFVSVGRNYKLGAFLVATAEQGEISPSLRRRTKKIYGRIISDGDLRVIKRYSKGLSEYLKQIPRFNFIYYNGKAYGPTHILDTVTNIPEDYVIEESEIEVKKGYNWSSFIFWVLFWLGLIWLFLEYFR
jgi:hypothetical protein